MRMNLMKTLLRGLGMVLLLIAFLAVWVLLPWYGALALAVALALWMALTRTGRQAASVTWVGVGTLRQRLGASSVVVVGIAGVVGVLVALLAMAEGYRHTVSSAGSEDVAIVLRGGSSAELMSVLSRDEILAIERAPQIARDAQGRPLASAELVVSANVPRRDGEEGSVTLRGVGEMAWAGRPAGRRGSANGPRGEGEEGSVPLRGGGRMARAVRPGVRLVDGRRFETGRRELVVGRGAQRQF